MASHKLFLLLSFFVFSIYTSDVLVLNQNNFDETLEANKVLLVEFYAPWCGHCKSLEPEYEKAATALKSKGVHIAKVDATVEESLASRFEIRGFPTLKFFKNGVFVQEYSGPRNAQGIVSFMEKKSGLPYTVVSSGEEVQNILSKEKNGVVVGYFDDLTSEKFLEFQVVAEKEDKIRFLVFSDSASASGCLLNEVQLDANTALAVGSVTVLAKDGSKHPFSGDLESGLLSFFYTHAFPQSSDLDPEVFADILAVSKIIVTAYDFSASSANDIRKYATEAVAQHTSLKQMFADSNKWAEALSRMGVASGKVFPTAIAFSQKEQPISWDEEKVLDAESFTAWIADVVAGTAQTWKKSEPIPTSNDGPVKVVVGKSFDEIVLDPSKDVLVEFYAPWCGHCKNLEPTYKSLGEHFASDSNIVIAKMDATANYVSPSLEVTGFPSIKFFPSGQKDQVLSYQGTRTLDDLIEFVSSNRNSKSSA